MLIPWTQKQSGRFYDNDDFDDDDADDDDDDDTNDETDDDDDDDSSVDIETEWGLPRIKDCP